MTGEQRWEYDTKQDGNSNEFHGESVLINDLLITGSDDRNPNGIGHIYAFDTETGEVRWKYDVKIGVPGKLHLNGSRIYALDFDESLHVLDLASGKLVHKIEGNKKHQEGYRIPSSPTIHKQYLFYALSDGRIRAIDMSNHDQIWERSLPAEVTSDITSNGISLFVATEDNSIYELSLKNGTIIRKIETAGGARWKLIAKNDRLLSLQWKDTVCEGLKGIDLTTGKEVWSQSAPEDSEWDTFRPLLWRDLILVGSDQGDLMAFDYRTGTQVWNIELDGNLRSIGASDSIIYAGASNGYLYAIIPPD